MVIPTVSSTFFVSTISTNISTNVASTGFNHPAISGRSSFPSCSIEMESAYPHCSVKVSIFPMAPTAISQADTASDYAERH